MSIPTIKIVVAGDLATGKSSLITLFIRSFFATDLDPTVEDTYNKQVNIDGAIYNLEIVDTVDNEFRDENERTSLYQDCDVIILTFAINDVTSFNNLIIRYSHLPINDEDGDKKLVYKNGRIKLFPPIILAGTKLDLEMSRQVAFQSAKKLSNDLKLRDYLECSSASNVRIEELFRAATILGAEHQNSEKDFTHLYMPDDDADKRQGSSNSSLVSRIIKENNQNQNRVKTSGNFSFIEENTTSEPQPAPPKSKQESTLESVKPDLKQMQKPTTATSVKKMDPPKESKGCCNIM